MRKDYNQIANYVYTQTEVNIRIGKKPPKQYMQEMLEQCNDKNLKYGGISDINELANNLRMNCIPGNILDDGFDEYEEFLKERRKLMAKKIKDFYYSL